MTKLHNRCPEPCERCPPSWGRRPLPQGKEPHPCGSVGAGRSSILDDAGWIKEVVTRTLAETVLQLRRSFTPCDVAWEKSIRRRGAGTGSR